MLHYLKLMLQLAMSPTRGWEDIATSADDSRHTFFAGLLPLILLASAAVFVDVIYHPHTSIATIIISAIVTFLKYAVTYFVANAILVNTLPRMTDDGLVNRDDVGLFCSYSIGMMVIIGIIETLLPMEITLLQFLPLYVVAIICLGRKFLNINSASIGRFAAVSITGIIIPVFLFDFLLKTAGV